LIRGNLLLLLLLQLLLLRLLLGELLRASGHYWRQLLLCACWLLEYGDCVRVLSRSCCCSGCLRLLVGLLAHIDLCSGGRWLGKL